MTINRLLTLAEVATRLRVSHDTVYRMAVSGRLAGSKVGRAWRFSEEAVTRLMDSPENNADWPTSPQPDESDTEFRDLYENSPDMHLSVDAVTGFVVKCNATLLLTLGYSVDEILGRPVVDLYSPASQPKAREVLQEFQQTGEIRDVELHVLTKEGHSIRVLLNATAIRNANGEFIRSRSVWRDISAHFARRQQEQLTTSGWLESIAGDIADAILVVNSDGHLVYANRLAQQLLQVDPHRLGNVLQLKERLSVYESDGVTPLKNEDWLCTRALAGETVPNTELLLVDELQQRMWVSARATPIRDRNDQIFGCVVVLHDIMENKDRERQLRLTEFTVTNSPDAVFWVAPDGCLKYVNDRACQSLGYSREELLQMKVPDIDPDVTPAKWPEIWQATVAQIHIHIESRHRTKQGRTFPVEILSRYVQYEGLEYGVAHVRDVTDRRRADLQLKESEERFQRAIAGSRDSVWDWDMATGHVWYSPQCKTQLGYGPDDHFPAHVDTWSEKVHPEDLPRVMVAIEKHVAGVAPYDLEYRMQTKQGEFRWFRVKGQAYWDADGIPQRMAGTTSDINDHRKALEQLEQRERKLQVLIDSTPSAIAMFDRQMRYVRCSRQWQLDFGLEDQNLIGRSHYQVFPDLPDRWKQNHQDCLKGQSLSTKQDVFERASGITLNLEWAIQPWIDEDGQIGGLVIFSRLLQPQSKEALVDQKRISNAQALRHFQQELANR
jgi:PAS domain S-box-containing protein/excisionase family DNA binding protein